MGGKIVPCEATKIKDQGKEEGIEIGAAKMIMKNVKNLMQNMSMSLVEALKALSITEQDYNNAKNLLGK